MNRELPQSSVASGHKYGEMQFHHTGTFDHFFFHYTRSHFLYKIRRQNFCSVSAQDRTPKFAGQVLLDRTESVLIFLTFENQQKNLENQQKKFKNF